ncbi:hypothetical protein IJH72_02185 [Candidatus Saccharibacteria bacterium]|nr:hypothetical protein [Candidatus Saccharibacteria bacterium]MBQ3321104.1 hypothetical protein [Candidatus Saccharibacteria bacterium]MBR0372728.1 hypothetical protein [Candidatus Saccharibacteria bacterium]
MFEIESKNQDEIIITTKKTTIKFNISDAIIDAGLSVGKITGPGEFEIGDATIRGVMTESRRTIYDVEIGGVHIGIVGGIEEGLDDIVADILCTSSVRAIREIEPKLIVAMGNVDGMVSELKLSARTEKKLKIKSLDSLPVTKEVVVLT